jgi:DNA-binding SARP family transcriptional activator
MAEGQQGSGRTIAVIGRLGVAPMVRLSIGGRRLLAYLAVRGCPTSRALVAATLWPDVSDDVARTNLRRVLWRVPAGWVLSVGDDLDLDAEADLPRAQAAARRALAGQALTLDEIVLLSADLLPGWHEEWAIAAQDTFRLLRVQALEAACRAMTAAGDFHLATQAGAAAVAAEPLCESAAEGLILAHLAQRNRYQALRCFRALADRLQGELGVSPDPALAERVMETGLAQAVLH